MRPHIYKLTLLVDTESFRAGQVYIGQHCGNNKNYFSGGNIPTRIAKKYGREAFKKEIIVQGDFNQILLDDLEKHYIRLYAANVKGLNLTVGGATFKVGKSPKVVYKHALNGVVIQRYKNSTKAAKELGLDYKQVAGAASPNSVSRRAGAFMWSYDGVELPPFQHNGIKIYQYDRDGNFIQGFDSINETYREVSGRGSVKKALDKPCNFARGFQWTTVYVDRYTPCDIAHKPLVLPVHQYDMAGKYIKSWDDARAVVEGTGIKYERFQKAARRNKTYKGYRWSYNKVPDLGPLKIEYKGKPVYIYALTGEYIKMFETAVGAADELGLSKRKIANAATDSTRGRGQYGGFLWSRNKKERVSPYRSIPVHQYSLDGKYIASHLSANSASRAVAITSGNIDHVVNKIGRTAAGFQWRTIKTEKCDAVKHRDNRAGDKRKVKALDKKNNVVRVFDSLIDAAIFSGAQSTNIIKVCKGLRKSTKGYKWQYV